MKLLSALILTTVSLCAGLCCSPEDEYNEIRIINNDVITIENNKTEYNLGDKIYIEITINNAQTSTENEDLLLTNYIDILDNSSYIESLLSLYKETNYGSFAKIPINNDNIEILEGHAETYYDDIFVSCNLKNNTFVCAFGITLLESGNFFLSGNYSKYYNEEKDIYFSMITNSTTYISMTSKIVNSNKDGEFHFIVNEK